MAGDIAVLLRDNYHSHPNAIRYALKCNDFVSQVAKTPIQIPIAQTPPTLIDIGFFRPAITLQDWLMILGEQLVKRRGIRV